VRFWSTANGKKAVMAVSGVVLVGFLFGHLAGNLQIFLGPDVFNGYARALRHLPALVWATRTFVLVAALLHIWSSLQLMVLRSDARPVSYLRKRSAGSSYASRTMYWSGPIVLAFVIYHLLQFTYGVGGTHYDEFDPYGNVIAGFRVPIIASFYMLAMGMLCFHLRHGLWSIFQTLGFYHPRYSPRIRLLANLVALALFFGFASIPAAVLTGFLPRTV
jgi:succinate dehydrogenase / fumarate reductase cytochrome b subunit